MTPEEVAERSAELVAKAYDCWTMGDIGLAAALFQAAMIGDIRNLLAERAKKGEQNG